VASGTAGSAVALPLAFVLAMLHGFWGILAAAAALFFIGVAASREVLKYTKHDPGLIVIDEVAGQLVTFLPLAGFLHADPTAWRIYMAGFALFRLFDISKPWPAGWADRKIRNEWGVMLDDAFAGTYAAACLWALWRFVL
jgi:phosphatidylglycerophosphatase A